MEGLIASVDVNEFLLPTSPCVDWGVNMNRWPNVLLKFKMKNDFLGRGEDLFFLLPLAALAPWLS